MPTGPPETRLGARLAVNIQITDTQPDSVMGGRQGTGAGRVSKALD